MIVQYPKALYPNGYAGEMVMAMTPEDEDRILGRTRPAPVQTQPSQPISQTPSAGADKKVKKNKSAFTFEEE